MPKNKNKASVVRESLGVRLQLLIVCMAYKIYVYKWQSCVHVLQWKSIHIYTPMIPNVWKRKV